MPGIEAGQLLFQLRTPLLQHRRPGDRIERMAVRLPGAEAQPARIRNDHKDAENYLWLCRRIEPCVVRLGLPIRRALAGGDRADLEAEDRAPNLEVELVAELRRGDAQV